jgi:hypothetical protein
MIQYRKTWQKTARITDNMTICRAFLRSVLPWVIDRHWMDTDHSHKSPAYSTHRNVAICRNFCSTMEVVGDAGDTLRALYWAIDLELSCRNLCASPRAL